MKELKFLKNKLLQMLKSAQVNTVDPKKGEDPPSPIPPIIPS